MNLGTFDSVDGIFLSVESLSELKGLDRLRTSSIEPTTIPEIFEMMANSSHNLMPYLHVPLQSGCDAVLSLMKRKYCLKEMNEFFARAVENVPNICIGTDLMTGFPGESQEDFQETVILFFFSFFLLPCVHYSEREGTVAAKSDQHIPIERRKRSAYLRTLSSSKRMDWHSKFCGQHVCTFENPKKESLFGYTDNYLKVMIPNEGEGYSNCFAKIRINEARPEYCIGQICGEIRF